MNCKQCGSDKLFFYKYMWENQTYHYKVWCQKCDVKYGVERNKYVYEKVKDMPWVYSSTILKQKGLAQGKGSAKKRQRQFIKLLRDKYYKP